ncbi:hypothetical protein VP01_2998g1 [Puccinia sorghi]|uniref:Uncharacterized protein n=1 Tax=Puccinia sorghi TaxID=27349 RepID=A0A0L6V0G7_9BASI|nr:hypothetical protein VP01_2998g1 [Puccinia sorghi]
MNEVIMCFLVWLYLCGLSQEKCRIARDHILAIINTFTHPKEDLEIIMAKNIRTILKHLNMNPNFTSYVFCLKCYTLYPLKTQQAQCLYQTTSRAPACASHTVKECVYWTERVQNTPLELVFNYQQSKGWKNTKPDKVEPNAQGSFLKLTFSLYVNWFNPFGNKLAGRQASFGVLALTCLDMPPHLHHQTHHLFLSGIIPGPKEPEMITMSNILQPLIDGLLVLNKGVRMSTFKFLNGRIVSARLGALIGDVVATHEVAGFASHATKTFCSYCFCKKQEINEICPGKLRHGRATISQSLQWREATTINDRDKIFKEYGNVVLGMMHNWYEGVLQHHFQIWWGFNVKIKKA